MDLYNELRVLETRRAELEATLLSIEDVEDPAELGRLWDTSAQLARVEREEDDLAITLLFEGV